MKKRKTTPTSTTTSKIQICAILPLEDHKKLLELARRDLTSEGHIIRKIIHNHLSNIVDEVN